MKNLPPFSMRVLIPLGLLLITIPFLLNSYIRIPDFYRGLAMGLGIGLEILGVILIRKHKISNN
jgi:hypothetical protein